MAIAIRGTTPLVVSTTANPISGTLTGTRQPQAGDLLVILHANDYYDLASMPTPTVGGSTSGVTAITNGIGDAGNPNAHVKTYTYAVASTGDLAVSVTETGSGDEEKVLVVYVLSGADTSTPIDGGTSGAAGSFSSTAQASFVLTGVTPAGSDALLIYHVNSGGGSAGGTPYTPPSGGYTEQYDTSTGGVSYTGGTLQLAVSGATGTQTVVGNGAGITWAGVLLAIKTGGAAAPPPIDPILVFPAPGRIAPNGFSWATPFPTTYDANPPNVVTEIGTTAFTTANASTVTTASFTPAANSLMVAIVGAGNGDAFTSALGTVTGSAGGSWTRLAGEADTFGATAEVWVKDAGASPSSQTVTYTPGGGGPGDQPVNGLMCVVKWYTGAAAAAQQPGATSLNGGTNSFSTAISATAAGSVLVMSHATHSASYTLQNNSSTVTIGQFNSPAGDTASVARANFASAAPGSVTLGYTNGAAGVQRMALAEILPATGANAFSASQTDSAGLTDTVSVVVAYARTAGDTAGLTDSVSVVVAYSRTVDDTAGLSDSVASAVAFSRTQTDDAALTDSVTAVVVVERSTTDTAGLIDAVSTFFEHGRTATDTAGLTDLLALAVTATVTDNSGFTDLAAAASAFARTATDDVGLTDTAAAQLAGAGTRQVDDLTGLTDTLALAVTATVVDGAGLTDSVTAAGVFPRTQTDTAGLIDSVAVELGKLVTVTDTAGLTDTRAVAVAFGRTQDDPAGFGDSLTTTFAAVRTVGDPLGLVDSLTAATTSIRTQTDTVGLTDSVSASLLSALAQVITDSVGLTSEHRAVLTTARPSTGVTTRPVGTPARTTRPYAGVTGRYPFVPD